MSAEDDKLQLEPCLLWMRPLQCLQRVQHASRHGKEPRNISCDQHALVVESGANLKLMARMLVVLLVMVASAYLQAGVVDVDVEGGTMDMAMGRRRPFTALELDKMLQSLQNFIADKGACYGQRAWHRPITCSGVDLQTDNVRKAFSAKDSSTRALSKPCVTEPYVARGA